MLCIEEGSQEAPDAHAFLFGPGAERALDAGANTPARLLLRGDFVDPEGRTSDLPRHGKRRICRDHLPAGGQHRETRMKRTRSCDELLAQPRLAETRFTDN